MVLKQTKASETIEHDDLISTLPDHVLCHILSFLPTKFAVLTSILSKRWSHLFTSVSDIDLSDSLLLHAGESSFISNPEESRPGIGDRFKSFVSKLLLARNSTNINKFRLFCAINYDYSTVSRWICDVLLLNVRDLDISVTVEKRCIVPLEIFTCRSLESLKLNFGLNCVLKVPDSVILPNLKELDLEYIVFDDDDSVTRFFSGCPALEKLSLFTCQLEDLETFEISLPSLKSLNLSNHCSSEYCDVILDTPDLQHLVCCFSKPSVYIMKNTKSLASAVIACLLNAPVEEIEDVGYIIGETVSKLVNGNDHLKSLSLSFSSLAALYYSSCSLAKFQNLTYMELSTSQSIGYLLLADLLESCPILEVLSFPEGFICLHNPEEDIKYRLPVGVPICLSRSLREIRIGDFNGREYEFELVEYFLKYSEVLRKMMIGCEVQPMFRKSARSLFKNFGVLPEWVSPTCNRLSEAPRKSEACQVVISWKEGVFWAGSEELCRRIV